MGEPHSRVLNDMVYKSDDGWPLCCCVFINEPTGAIFCHDDLWRGTGTCQPQVPTAMGTIGSASLKPSQELLLITVINKN